MNHISRRKSTKGCRCPPRHFDWSCTRTAHLGWSPEKEAVTSRPAGSQNTGGFFSLIEYSVINAWFYIVLLTKLYPDSYKKRTDNMHVKMWILLVSTVVPWWAQETSGSPGVPSSHRWILSQLPCTLHSTGSSIPRSGSICWGCRYGVPRNSQLQPPPQCGCPRLPLGSAQCRRSLNDMRC